MTERNEGLLAWAKTATDAEIGSTGTTRDYLRQIGYGHKTASVEMAVRIETVSKGAATRQQLRPDDWREMWPELALEATQERTASHDVPTAEPGTPQSSFILESRGPLPGTHFFDNDRSGFPSAEHMLQSRLWFEEGASGKLELRFACRPQPFQTLIFCLNGGYLVFDLLDFVRSRAVFSASGWHSVLPEGLAEPIGWLDASGPLPGAPLAGGESGSSHA